METIKILEIIGTLVGLLYIWYQYKADQKVWWASLLMALPFIYVNFKQGLYATFALYVYYFVVAARELLKTSKEPAGTFVITHIPIKTYLPLTVVFATLMGALYLFLTRVVQDTHPIADAFATALSFISMWLLSKRYLQQWLAWIAVDIVYSVLYLTTGQYFFFGMFAFYTVTAVLGYFNWRKLMQKQSQHV